MEAKPGSPRSNIGLLNVAETFLRQRDFTNCYNYAIKAQKSNPNDPRTAQIIGVATTLMATRPPNRPDWYKILHLPSSGFDPNDVFKRFNMLNSILSPAQNPYPFAAEAHEWVVKAYSVLSDPIRRAQFDNDKGTFWTACPFCFYLYEYEKMFLECCLRCQNVKCRRSFTALPVSEKVAPPPCIVEKGNYYPVHGFSQAVNDKEGGGQIKGRVPIDSSDLVAMPGQNSGRVNANKGNQILQNTVRVTIGSHGSIFGSDQNSGRVNENKELQMGHNTGRVNESNVNQKGDTFIGIVSDDENEGKGSDDEQESKGMEFGNQDFKVDEAKQEEVVGKVNDNEGKATMKRRKMMTRTTKKVTGRGVRVNMDEILRREGDEDEREDSRMKDDGEGNGDIGSGDAN